MFIRGEIIDDIPQCTISFKSEIKVSPEEAIAWLKEESGKIDSKSPLHYNRIVISSKIELWFPGKYDKYYPGDYLLTWEGKAPAHIDVCDAIIADIKNNSSENPDYYRYWLELLEDVYYSGTLNLKNDDEKDSFKRQLIFWVTLQEDINRSKNLGRLTPFCRYAEAIATTIEDYQHTYDEVVARVSNNSPELLERWEIPNSPKCYKWSAF